MNIKKETLQYIVQKKVVYNRLSTQAYITWIRQNINTKYILQLFFIIIVPLCPLVWVEVQIHASRKCCLENKRFSVKTSYLMRAGLSSGNLVSWQDNYSICRSITKLKGSQTGDYRLPFWSSYRESYKGLYWHIWETCTLTITESSSDLLITCKVTENQ